MPQITDFNAVRAAFRDGDINSAANAELQKAIGVLANTGIPNDNVRHEAIIMAEAIHSILLRRLLDHQEKRNQKAQFWFMVLAVAGLLSAVVQIVVAVVK